MSCLALDRRRPIGFDTEGSPISTVRSANRALHTIALVRMSCDARTRDYVRARRAKGPHPPEIVRLLKRAIAREVFKSLTRGLVAPDLADLRPARQAKNITLRAAATAMNTYPNKILRTERGTFHDYDLAEHYRTRPLS
jgi:hypothetical protein